MEHQSNPGLAKARQGPLMLFSRCVAEKIPPLPIQVINEGLPRLGGFLLRSIIQSTSSKGLRTEIGREQIVKWL